MKIMINAEVKEIAAFIKKKKKQQRTGNSKDMTNDISRQIVKHFQLNKPKE